MNCKEAYFKKLEDVLDERFKPAVPGKKDRGWEAVRSAKSAWYAQCRAGNWGKGGGRRGSKDGRVPIA